MTMRRLWPLAATVLVLGCAADVVSPPDRPMLQLLPIDPASDSLGFGFSWPAVTPSGDQAPVAGYQTALFDTPSDLILDAGFTTGTVDTLWALKPPIGEENTVHACVQTEDIAGQYSVQRCSGHFTFALPYMPPSPPDTVIVDTVPRPVALTAVEVIPGIVGLADGGIEQLCAVGILADGATGVLGPWDSFEQQAYCELRHEEWLQLQGSVQRSTMLLRSG
jgi:hypothetical protein